MTPRFLLVFIVFLCSFQNNQAQNFLHADGQNIVDGNGENVILRGMGLGGWMLQEGYMMLSADVANTQHTYKEKMVDLIGQDGMEAFYDAWLANHCTKADIDLLKAAGFNSVRLPMHYNLYTLPIEDEPVPGQQTWLTKGFEMTDSLLAWCEANEMYLILDLHAAPGGQGYDEAISDYDPDKPSLWESPANRAKTVALWGRLAERYADEEWIGGYDLLNEVNWDLPGGSLLKSLYVNITNEIRAVDNNHIIYIEGNWFANDFTGLTPPWDDNLVYSFHKYWSINDDASIQWVLDMRNQHNVPLWLGESGENSNTWFRDAIALCESHNIGWAWWPMKKLESISGTYAIEAPYGYQDILDYWGGTGTAPTEAVATATFMQLAENAKSANCTYNKSVIDAMIRQVDSDESIPCKDHNIPGLIYLTDFDLGPNGVAYLDVIDANYHLSTGEYTAWNSGWQYRNDGVDIGPNYDVIQNNDYGIGWTEAGEWINYTVDVAETGFYEFKIRTTAQGGGGGLRLQKNGVNISPKIFLPSTGSWQSWQTTTMTDIYLEAGTQTLTIVVENPGSNLSFMEFVGPTATSDFPPYIIAAATNVEGSRIQMDFQKPLDVTTVPTGDFTVKINNSNVTVTNITPNPASPQSVFLDLATNVVYDDNVRVSYATSGVVSTDGQNLDVFLDYPVKNNLPEPAFYHQIPGKIEVEDFVENNGFEFETCTDIGGGQNAGYTDVGDYLDFLVNVQESGLYQVSYRVAAESQTGSLSLQSVNGAIVQTLNSIVVPNTGGWQNWETVTGEVILAEGQQRIRLRANSALYNINWIDFDFLSADEETTLAEVDIQLFPNPSATNAFTLNFKGLETAQTANISIVNNMGKILNQQTLKINNLEFYTFDNLNLSAGIYFIQVEIDGAVRVLKWVKI